MKTDQIQKVHKDWYKLDLSAIVSYIAEERFLFRVSIVCAVKRRYRPGNTAAGGESDDASFSDV